MRTHENVGVLELAWRSLLGGDKLVTEHLALANAVYLSTNNGYFVHYIKSKAKAKCGTRATTSSTQLPAPPAARGRGSSVEIGRGSSDEIRNRRCPRQSQEVATLRVQRARLFVEEPPFESIVERLLDVGELRRPTPRPTSRRRRRRRRSALLPLWQGTALAAGLGVLRACSSCRAASHGRRLQWH